MELRPSKGRVFNSLKMRDGFLNRVNLVKEEIKFEELKAKGKKRVPGVTVDPKYTSLSVIMRVLKTQYSDNIYMIKEALSYLIKDEDFLKKLIQKNKIQSFKQTVNYEHFKALLAKNGQEERLDEVRLRMSNEFFNQLNFVLY